MATNNLSALSSALNSVTNGATNETVDKVKDEAQSRVGYIQSVVKDYGNYTDEQKSQLRSDPIGFLKSGYEAYQSAQSENATQDKGADTTTEKTYTPREGQDNVYAGQNTVDHSDELKQQYDATLEDYNKTIDDATDASVKAAESYQKASQAEYDKLRDVSRKDYDEAIATREAVEANNGNRDGIGHSQYGTLEQAYNSRLGELADAEQRLRTQTTRAVADARANGDYQKANALLSTAQAKLKAIYEEQMRIDKNLRSNYEWQTEIDQDDKKIQAELDATDLAWQRSVGEALLKAGIVPGMDILDGMGLSREMATKIAKYAKIAGSSGGSGSSGSGDGSYEDPNGGIPVAGNITDEDGNIMNAKDRNEKRGYTFTEINDRAKADASKNGYYSGYSYISDEYNAGNLTQQEYRSLTTSIDKYK